LDPDWLEAFAAGWQALAAPFDLALVGGDLGRGALSVTVTLVGTVPPGMALQRAGAKPGDALYVSGTLGDPRLYLDLLRGTRSLPPADADYIHSRYARPIPRVSLGEHLRGIASAAIDISDGLLADLGHLAKASALAASVDLAILPLSPALRAALSEEEAWIYATSGGDDYELLFTLPPGREAALRHAMASLAVTVIRIGYMGSGDEIVCRTESGTPWSPPATGYAHF
jgi:thiamine-monophosphate kinase